MEGCTVAVIGGGPAGILAAAQFAKLGATVTVYERCSVSQQNSAALGWVIGLGQVARNAIEAAGLCADFLPSARCARGYSFAPQHCPKQLCFIL